MVLTPELLLRRAAGGQRSTARQLPMAQPMGPASRFPAKKAAAGRLGGSCNAMAPVGRRAAGKSHEGARIGGDVGSSYCPSRRVWFWRWIVRLETRSQR